MPTRRRPSCRLTWTFLRNGRTAPRACAYSWSSVIWSTWEQHSLGQAQNPSHPSRRQLLPAGATSGPQAVATFWNPPTLSVLGSAEQIATSREVTDPALDLRRRAVPRALALAVCGEDCVVLTARTDCRSGLPPARLGQGEVVRSDRSRVSMSTSVCGA
eukprot:446163-Rhodomonas_salina.1